MTLRKLLLASAMLAIGAAAAQAAEPDSCKTVRMADVGWSDNTAQNGLFKTVLKGLGYTPEDQVLALPVIIESLKNKDLDIFLDNWMPSNAANVQPYLDAKTIEMLNANLTGAGYGPVVPKYVADAGVKDVKDLAANADKFEKKFYGIEPGNDGNKIVQAKIDDPANGLQGWELVESSEQGMLAQAQKSMKKQEWIAFLGWTPHPVMGAMKITYLDGMGDSGFGAATVHTNVRKGYTTECPNVGKFIGNLKFNLDMEGEMMDAILKGGDANTVATDWLKAHPDAVAPWLAGVTTFDGGDAAAAVKTALGG